MSNNYIHSNNSNGRTSMNIATSFMEWELICNFITTMCVKEKKRKGKKIKK